MMALSQAELDTVERLKTEGGDEWQRFRARRNTNLRRFNGDEVKAVRKALEPLMKGNVINLDRSERDDDEFEALDGHDWSTIARAAVCVVMVCLTTGYQIYAQRNLYAEGSEGLFLAAMLDIMIVGLAVLMPSGWGLRIVKYGLIAFVVTHMALTLESAAVQSVKAQSPELARLQERYADTKKLYADIPASRVSDRMKVNAELARIEGDIQKAGQAMGTAAMFGTGSSDIRTRVRWINLIAQLFFAHMLGLIIMREIVPHGTLSRVRRALS